MTPDIVYLPAKTWAALRGLRYAVRAQKAVVLHAVGPDPWVSSVIASSVSDGVSDPLTYWSSREYARILERCIDLGSVTIVTKALKAQDLFMVYAATGVEMSRVYRLGVKSGSVWYVSLNFTEIVDITPADEMAIQHHLTILRDGVSKAYVPV